MNHFLTYYYDIFTARRMQRMLSRYVLRILYLALTLYMWNTYKDFLCFLCFSSYIYYTDSCRCICVSVRWLLLQPITLLARVRCHSLYAEVPACEIARLLIIVRSRESALTAFFMANQGLPGHGVLYNTVARIQTSLGWSTRLTKSGCRLFC